VPEQANLHPEEPKQPKIHEMPEKKVPCFKADKLPAGKMGEMDRQLAGQQAGLNDMTVQEYMDGRAAYQVNGRGDPGVSRKARTGFKDKLIEKTTDDLVRQGYSDEEAEAMATKSAESTMKTLAALHNPDQVVAGANVITDFGDSQVNSTIGGQWASNIKGTNETRVGLLDKAAAAVLPEKRATTRMNASLERCK
jgi:hypothetical protein